MNTLFTIICLACGFCAVNGSVIDFFRSKRQSSCGKGDFACNSGQCIEQFSVCDGKKDCRDGSDETQAICDRLEIKCPAYAFRCAYGACVDRFAVCDGRRDCVDNSDELLPECLKNVTPTKGKCRKHEFMCASGQCIDEFSVCDGVADCNDKTDETITQCVSIRCPEFSFQCAYGACIDGNKKCNGVANDCVDGSDEDEELCNNPLPPRPTRPPLPPTRTPFTSPPSKRPTTIRPTSRPIIPPFDTSSVFCVLPKQPEGGSYRLQNCPPFDRSPQCQNKQGTPVPVNSILSYTCNEGYILSTDNPHIFCLNGDWNTPPLECNKECSKLEFDSLDVECTYKGEPVDCSKKMKPGTTAKGSCKPSYRIPEQFLSYLNKEPVCLQNGKWDEQLFRCEPECGKRNYDTEQTLINGGNATKVGEFPWHAGLYCCDDSPPLRIICGGSIISSRAILTAAHCVYIDKEGRGRDPTTLKVAVGKYNSSWESTDIYEQKLAVKQIILPRAYKGKLTSYVHDISILELERAIQFGTAVLPVCIDWHSQIKFQINSYGFVVGWGLDEHKQISDVLKLVQMQLLDYETCTRNSPKQFQSFITYDKFCTNYNQGQGVQQGDSGGGLTFEQSDLHFIYGIVSVKPRDQNTFAAFTNITEHLKWIGDVVKAVNFNSRKFEQD